jgi:hypothetical protein
MAIGLKLAAANMSASRSVALLRHFSSAFAPLHKVMASNSSCTADFLIASLNEPPGMEEALAAAGIPTVDEIDAE